MASGGCVKVAILGSALILCSVSFYVATTYAFGVSVLELGNAPQELEKLMGMGEPSANVEEKKETTATKRDLSSEKKPLNILLLYGDDWRHDSLGSASNGLVKTPFLDKLATEGIRFTHNCVTTSVCWISRATLYSGLYVSRHNSTQPTTPHFYKGWNQTFPFLLREKGYYFGHVGKWHFDTSFLNERMDWKRMYYGRHWYETKEGMIHSTKRNEQDALDFLRERPKDQPFCLTVCFFTPHSQDGHPEQYLPQNESMSMYVDDTIPLAPSATEEAWKKMPTFFEDLNEGRHRWRLRFDTLEKYQKMMKNYYRLISEIDSTSGEIYCLKFNWRMESHHVFAFCY
jgi:arylsulfatase A-like enzyme